MRPLALLALLPIIVLACNPVRAQDPYPGVLEPVGALHCLASHVEDQPKTTEMDCQFRAESKPQDPVRLEGTIVGSGLYLVDPGEIRLMWRVLAATPDVNVRDIAGDYDIESSYRYKLRDARKNILYGGLGDSFALELIAPAPLDGITASTRLTLRLKGRAGLIGDPG